MPRRQCSNHRTCQIVPGRADIARALCCAPGPLCSRGTAAVVFWRTVVRWNVRDCLFCLAYDGSVEDLAWHDRPLSRRPEIGVAIAGLGAFVPGYVLVSPAEHKSSMQ